MLPLEMYMSRKDKPFVLVLIGPPLSGKSTALRTLKIPENTVIVSQDELYMETTGTRDYKLAYELSDQKEIKRILRERLTKANDTGRNVIVDMTNLSSKRRKHTLSYFPRHRKLALVFPILSSEEYAKRNEKRALEENKFIPGKVMESMMNSYVPITPDEKFDKVFTYK